ncbi:MAG: transcriptional antiterminator RfaH [Algoriphagus sp.]|jgi:transcriptional antiterminator RfaH
MNWFVLYTKSRFEKKVAKQLLDLGIEAYCPTVKKERQWSDRKKMIDDPLFKSYVFVRLEEKYRDQVFAAEGAVRFLYWLKKPAIVTDKEITTIKDFLGEYDYEEIEVQTFSTEDRIRIKSGPLYDTEGVIKHMSSNQVVIYIPTLGMKVFLDLRKHKLVQLKGT